jgi:hypothetical protein
MTCSRAGFARAFPLALMLFGLVLQGCGKKAEPASCTPGTEACACAATDRCNDGLICGDDRRCRPATSSHLAISDPAARGCEFVLTESAGTQVSAVRFAGGAKGSWRRQAPQVAVAVVAGGDVALSNAVELDLGGPAAGLQLGKISCVDRLGRPTAGGLSLK